VEAIRRKKARKNLWKQIRKLRISQKISQAQLAFESGLSRQQISYLESGLKNATFDTLLSIAETLDVNLKDLLDFDY
jgi:transcriptional regulator with XRE-family HTH domain